ncbi:hypothetical protein ACLB2K_057428 [Fragaria x ananassa]
MADSTQPDDHTAAVKPYNPYQDLDAPIKKLYHLPTAPEHLFPDVASRPYRSWGNNLQHCTGICFLSGGTVGLVHGAVKGLKAAGAGESRKVMMSRALSSGLELGGRYSGTMGILGFYFSVIESGIDSYRGKEGILNTGAAGFGAGAMYKAARGPRAMAVAGVIGGAAAVAAVSGKTAVKKYVGEVGVWGF